MRRRQALGQHFLRDRRILERLARSLRPSPDDTVLEIGPGEGTLTEVLAPQVGRLVAIEKDRRLAAQLVQRSTGGTWPGVRPEVILGDALEVDWHRAAVVPGFKVAGNIPYQITSPLIDKALEPPRPVLIVFLVQREVAARLTARPGTREYGALTVGVRAVAAVEWLFAVRAGAFSPPPRVESAAVRMTALERPLVRLAEEADFRRFVTACFGQRRKQLGRALRAVWGREAAVVEGVLRRLDLDPARRGETLAPAEFVSLLRAGGGL